MRGLLRHRMVEGLVEGPEVAAAAAVLLLLLLLITLLLLLLYALPAAAAMLLLLLLLITFDAPRIIIIISSADTIKERHSSFGVTFLFFSQTSSCSSVTANNNTVPGRAAAGGRGWARSGVPPEAARGRREDFTSASVRMQGSSWPPQPAQQSAQSSRTSLPPQRAKEGSRLQHQTWQTSCEEWQAMLRPRRRLRRAPPALSGGVPSPPCLGAWRPEQLQLQLRVWRLWVWLGGLWRL